MKKKIRIISLILAAVLLTAAIVSSVLLCLPGSTDGKHNPSDAEVNSIEGETDASEKPETVVPPIEPNQPTDGTETDKKTDLQLDVSQIERQTSPVYIGGSVEYETKEVPTNEDQP
jgi:flagellar basal body-associated protein FliL